MSKSALCQVLLALPMLAGCGAFVADLVPQAARLSNEILTVQLSNGTICRTTWAVTGGAGRLQPCGPGFDYAVREIDDPNLLRQLFSGITDALGADGVMPPMAEVVISDRSGRRFVFVSPPGV